MKDTIYKSIAQLGTRIKNYGYLLANPTYSKVRRGRGCADLYRLLNQDWFPQNKIQLVLDVGANEGQFIRTSLALMPKVPIYAFEPNPASVQKLQMSNWDGEKVKIFSVALGTKVGTLPLNISKFSPASSLLQPSSNLSSEFPETEIEATVDVKIERLDTLIQDIGVEQGYLLLKIDVQGFELEVLEGAIGILDQVAVIVCEVNIATLYEKQCSFESIVAFLRHYQYNLIDIGNPIRSHITHELMYLDLAFIKNELLS
jgi:FkbM family methyltransferase